MKKRADGRYVESFTVDGKRHFVYGGSPAEAKRKLRKYKNDRDDGRTFEAVAEEWENEHNQALAFNTQNFYRPITSHAVEYFGAMLIKDIDAGLITDWLKSLCPTYGRKSISNHKSVVNMIMAYAVLKKDIDANPARDATAPKNARKGHRSLPDDDKIKFIAESGGDGVALLPFLLLHTGCRRGEALALRWCDIDFDENIISVKQQIEYHNNRPKLVAGTKTEAGVRIVFLSEKLAAALLPLRGKPEEYIFGGADAWSYTTFRRAWERFCKSAGFIRETKKAIVGHDNKPVEKIILTPTITAHQLRHAYVTMLFEAGVDSKTATYLVGHADEKTMHEIYEHLRFSKAKEAREKINKFMW